MSVPSAGGLGESLRSYFSKHDAVFAFATAMAFGIAAFLSINATRDGTQIAAIWPAIGILLASLLQSRTTRARRLVLALCFIANVLAAAASSDQWLRIFVFSSVNTGHAILAFTLVRRFVGARLEFGRRDTVIRFMLVGGILAPFVAGIVAACMAKLVLGAPVLAAFKTWFMARSLGVMVVTPACLTLLSKQVQGSAGPRQSLPYAVVLAAVLATVFAQSSAPLLFLVFPILVGISMRLGPRASAFAALVTSSVAITCTYKGWGPLALMAGADPAAKVFVLQAFCLVAVLTSLAVAAAVAERERLRRHLERLSVSLAESRRKLDVALNQMCQGLCMFGSDGRMIMRNPRFLELYRLGEQDVPLGLPIDELMRACARHGVSPQAEGYLPDFSASKDFDQALGDGRYIRVAQRRLDDGTLVCTYTDVSDDKRVEEQLVYRMHHDALTDLANRRFMDMRVAEALARARRGVGFALLLIDVDHFKSINDNHGHAVGDAILVALAARMTGAVRESDFVARLGGDEFAVILESVAHEMDVEPIARRLLDICEREVLVAGKRLPVSLSVGVAFAPRDADTAGALFKAADTALYRTKNNGRNGRSYYSEWGSSAEYCQAS